MSLYIHLQFDYRSQFPHPRLQIPARSAIFLLSLPSCASIFTTIRCFNLFFLRGFRVGIVDVECDLCHCCARQVSDWRRNFVGETIMAQSHLELDKLLNEYIHNYFLKRKLYNSAKVFMTEAKIDPGYEAIDSPEGFLLEWWTVFWEIYLTRANENYSEPAAAYIKTQLYKMREQQQQQQLQMQQLQQMQQQHPGGPMDSERMDENNIDSGTQQMAPLKQLIQGNTGGMSGAMQQMQVRPQLAASSIYGQAILQSKYGLGGAGLNQVSGLSLKGWPPTGINQLGTSSGLHKPNQQALAQAQIQGNFGNSSFRNYGSPMQSDFSSSQQQYQLQHPQQMQQTHAEHKTETSKGFSFREVGCIRAKNKVTCCHFSPNGKWLACAGLDKKPSCCLHAYTGHTSHVMSLDFHPKQNDLFCFSDGKHEIQYWIMNPFSRARISKQEGSGQVRFQPITGQLLAAASDKLVSIFDVKTDKPTHSFQGHSGVVSNICWDVNGDHLASVSEDCVKVWSLRSGECIRQLNSVGNKFYSCVFHPSYPSLLIVGGLGSLKLWAVAENKTMTVPAHENIIAALAQCPVTGMIASASHDNSVKLWK
ncbi:hypothetical protein ABFS82_14G209600 [Erythranthe guttata]|uniref:transcriptional corepressor LEUNIG-like isoform X1 n=1 Tax=Erythranthe guttata TaxID=4155 RepID=UPI00064D955A|nr:PREDICTED: transcriptional corepressor LEUNIG-like isoform X1 [Erythranthe guttata]|eukprot:XP_012829032.1 PREDICTED: transcriptional corepressor LEUNIG-like isoform X1 [Erythranthe guttata]